MATIQGMPELLKKLAAMGATVQSQAVGDALTAGAQLVVNDAKTTVAVKTGTLQRSIHSSRPQQSDRNWYVRIGTNVEYAKKQEYRAGKAYLRPAFDNQKDNALTEVGEALADLVRASAQ
jgi:HK97 gp10 family phage protein